MKLQLAIFKSFLIVLLMSSSAWGSTKWSASYRAEVHHVSNPQFLEEEAVSQQYFLHHFILEPQITIADGFYVDARIDLLNSADLKGEQMGQRFGECSNFSCEGDTEGVSDRRVTYLYLNYIHQLGHAKLGRSGTDFGLGMLLDAGDEHYDYWLDIRDQISYKLFFQKFSVEAAYAQFSDPLVYPTEKFNEQFLSFAYEMVQDFHVGFLYWKQQSLKDGSTISNPNKDVPHGGAKYAGLWDITHYNFFVQHNADNYNFSGEASLRRGELGVVDRKDNPITARGLGVAVEANWKPKGWIFSLGAKAGMASGDDPSTKDIYEGFQFHRNYDVAMFLMNKQLGSYDVSGSGQYNKDQKVPLDTETIANVRYANLNASLKLYKNWTVRADATTAFIDTRTEDVDTSLGQEVNVTITYKPHHRLSWRTRAGILFPGLAYAGGDANHPIGQTYGATTGIYIAY